MKKTALILLISVYSLSIWGIGIQQFYCCGKLESTSISFIQHIKQRCGNNSAMSDCCQTKFKSLKVKDSHVAADVICSPAKYFTDLHLFTAIFDVMALAKKPMYIAYASHAPPLHHDVPIYILHCVFRI
jgi:hypothetical protein